MIKEGTEQVKEEKEIQYIEKNDKKYRLIIETEDDFSHIESFRKKYERGLKGKNKSLSMGLKKLNSYFGLRKQIMYLVGGYTGSGKTSFVDDAFVLNPIEFIEANKLKTNFHVIYFSMERSKDYKIARWISRKIFLETEKIIPLETILGWINIPNEEERILIEKYFNYANNLFEQYVTIFEGPINPTGLYREIGRFAAVRGKWENVIIRKKNGFEYEKKIYIPNDEDELILVIVDTIQLTKEEMSLDKHLLKGKELLDKMSEYLRWCRDTLGYSPIAVSQFNRDISDPTRLKMGDVEPRLEDKYKVLIK